MPMGRSRGRGGMASREVTASQLFCSPSGWERCVPRGSQNGPTTLLCKALSYSTRNANTRVRNTCVRPAWFPAGLAAGSTGVAMDLEEMSRPCTRKKSGARKLFQFDIFQTYSPTTASEMTVCLFVVGKGVGEVNDTVTKAPGLYLRPVAGPVTRQAFPTLHPAGRG